MAYIHPKQLGCLVTALAIALAGNALAQQQRIVAIPEAAKRADITFQGTPDLAIDGKAARLSPGARIYDRNNYLQMSGSLSGTMRAKYLLEPITGLVHAVWILTDEEIARPDPESRR